MKILFVCSGNVCRSRMAEIFFNALASPLHYAQSAGIQIVRPVGEPRHDFASQCMTEKGYNFVEQAPKQLTEGMVVESDAVIVMTENNIPDFLKDSPKVQVWDIRDFEGAKLEEHRLVANQIEQKVKGLIKEL